MHAYHITEFAHSPNTPIIDRGFDRFELNTDLKASLCEVEIATFYHDALILKE